MDLSSELEILRTSLNRAEYIQRELDRRVFHLKTLYDVSKDIFASVESNTILKAFLMMTMGNFGVFEGFILTMNSTSREDAHFVHMGFAAEEAPLLREEGKKLLLQELANQAMPNGVEQYSPPILSQEEGCVLAFHINDEYSGLIRLGSKLVDEPYNKEDIELLKTLSNNLVIALKNARSFEEISRLNEILKAKNIELTGALDSLAKAYEDLQAAQARIIENEKLERELQLAKEIQESMLPRSLPKMKGFDFGALMAPARQVGGDFFDFIPFSPDALGIAVGDVSGKGVPAAIFMGLTRSLIRAEAGKNVSPRKALEGVNRHLLDMNDSGMFVTVLYGILDRVTGNFNYVRAGHEPPLLCNECGAPNLTRHGNGQPLGIVPDVLLDEQTLTLSPGDTLFLYTDGLTDAIDAKRIRFGREKVQDSLRACCHINAQAVCDRLLETAIDYESGAPQNDDITLVAVRFSLNAPLTE